MRVVSDGKIMNDSEDYPYSVPADCTNVGIRPAMVLESIKSENSDVSEENNSFNISVIFEKISEWFSSVNWVEVLNTAKNIILKIFDIVSGIVTSA